MTCNNCNTNKPYHKPNQCAKPCETMKVQELSELPIDDLESMPSFFLTERDIVDQSTGNILHSITRLPAERVIPTGNLDNVFTLDANNPSLTIPEGQVVPCYVRNEGTQNVVYPADATNPAQFFAIGTYGDLLLCQATGVINILAGTEYIIGQPYYLSSTAGEVTTSKTQTGQYLFTPVSQTKLLLNIQRM